MKEYDFNEATPLIDFFNKNQEKIIGSRLKRFYGGDWPAYGSYRSSDLPIVLELDDIFVVVHYYFVSDIGIIIGTKDEVSQNENIHYMINKLERIIDYRERGFARDAKQEEIENCKIIKITVNQFSSAFECNPVTEEIRPDGGDYFSTIRLYLDSGTVLCFCGEDSMADGYITVWCE